MEVPSLCTIFVPFLFVLCRRGVPCMCSGSAQVWERLCSPGESNSVPQVPRSLSGALFDSPTCPPSTSSCSIPQTTEGESDNNPFHKIPTVLLEQIISSLPRDKKMKNFNIGFLITTELKKLIIPNLCNEQYLNFRKLETLQVLVLQKTNVGDSCLKIIGTWCKNLRVLDVNHCSRVTDTGIEWLILPSSDLRNTLHELLISCRSVTKRGTQMAVQHFSALQVIENQKIFDVLVAVVKSAAIVSLPPQVLKFAFIRLNIRPAGLYRKGNLGLVVECCPGLLDLTIVVKKGLKDSDLFCLTNLKNLRVLRIMGVKSSTGDEITFDMGIALVLKVVGNSLKVLDLAYLEVVDIWTIVKFCPNLNSLIFQRQSQSLSSLSENEIIQLRKEKGRVIFEDLKILECGFNLSNDILFGLLSCPLLEEVEISDCDALTDNFLQEAMTKGIFKNLEVLCFTACNLVTKQGLDALLLNENRLVEIIFSFCNKVTLRNVYNWYKIARRNNWKLILEFENLDTERIIYPTYSQRY